MTKRPLSISIIAWFMIVISSLEPIKLGLYFSRDDLRSVLLAEMQGHATIPVWLQAGLYLVQAIIVCVSGIGIFKGQRWARTLYMISYPIAFSLTLAILSFKISMYQIAYSISVYLALLFFLFRRSAKDFFANN